MGDIDLTQLNLDVYMTREGPWNPDHGEIEIPDEWDFLPSGDAFVTRRVKASGAYWVAWRPRGRDRPHRRRLGLWAPKEAIETASTEAAATQEQRAKQREEGAKAREKQEVVYRDELEEAISRFLAFAPEHTALADQIARDAATRPLSWGVDASGALGPCRSTSELRWPQRRSFVIDTPGTRTTCSTLQSRTHQMKDAGITISRLKPSAMWTNSSRSTERRWATSCPIKRERTDGFEPCALLGSNE